MSIAIRQRIIEHATPHLEPGETVQHAFLAQAVSPYWSLLSYWIIIVRNGYRPVVVTDRRVIVFQGGRLSTTAIKGVLRSLPRATRIGPASGLWYKSETLGEVLWIHRRFQNDVNEADAALGG